MKVFISSPIRGLEPFGTPRAVRPGSGGSAWQGYLVDGLERMRARGDLVASTDPQELATAVFAGMQGGLLLAKTRKEARPLRIALDAALAYLRSFAPDRSRGRA